MKHQTLLISALLLCINISVFAQKRLELSKQTTQKSYEFSGYTALDIASDFEVELNFSDTEESLTVEANSNLIDKVTISKKGNTLVFRLDDVWNTKGKMILNVTISTKPIINKFELASDAILTVNSTVVEDSLDLDLRSDSVFTGDLKVGKLGLTAKSDAVIKLTGSVNNMTASLSSDSQLLANELTIQDVKIKLSGDSEANITVVKSMDAYASGDSILQFSGNPEIQKKRSTGDAEIISVH